MSQYFLISSGVLENPKFLSVPLLARNIYLAMILATDSEGRASADPLTWMAKASLFGPAAVPIDEVAKAIDELSAVGLIVRYEVKNKNHLFLPGRFEHNSKRDYWTASKIQPPPLELLRNYPEYLDGLQRITTKGKMRNTLDPKGSWRYPEYRETSPVFAETPESGGNHQGTRRESAGKPPMEVEVEVEVEVDQKKRGRNPIPAVDNTTKEPSAPPAAEDSPSGSPFELNNRNQKKGNAGVPTQEQARMLETMSQERGRDVVDVARDCGIGWPIRAGNPGEVQLAVSTMKKKIIKLGDLSKTGQKAYQKRMEFEQYWEKVESNLLNPERVAQEIEAVAESEPKVAMQLLVRVVDWMGENSRDGFGGSRIVATWDTLTNLPAAYRSAGIGSGPNPPKEIDQCCAALAMEK